MRWAGHEECMMERRGDCRDLWGNLNEKDNLEDLVVDGMMISN